MTYLPAADPDAITAATTPRRPIAAGTAPRILAGLAAAIGATTLVGWIFGVHVLTQLEPGLASMKFNTAFCLITLGVSWQTTRPRVVAVLAGITGLIAVLTLIEHAVGRNLGIDQLVVADPSSAPNLPGRMAIASAVSLLLLATSRILISASKPRWVPAAAGTVFVITAVACLGYLYGVRSLYRVGPLSTISIQAGTALLLMSSATWLSTPGLVPWIARGQDAGALMMRRLLPVVLGALPVIGYVVLIGLRAGRYPPPFAMALFVAASALLVSAVTVRAARRLADVDRGRMDALNELTALNDELEHRVHERTALLAAERTRVAVFEDRERIAADLHDNVIQRLFGLGLQLASAASRASRPDHAQLLREAIDDIDTSIQELRVTIFALKRTPDTPNPIARLHACVDESVRLLGFDPAFSVFGDPAALSAPLLAAVEAVLREALSNVVRHAQATSTDIELTVDEDWVTLVVADDGIGLDPATIRRASGTTNIRWRAEALGGTATWAPAEPHGTTLTWRVPAASMPGD